MGNLTMKQKWRFSTRFLKVERWKGGKCGRSECRWQKNPQPEMARLLRCTALYFVSQVFASPCSPLFI